MLPITLRQLEIFAAISRREHVTQAAAELHLTQSAVSMALAELERQLNGPLFHRQGRRLRLNDRGRLVQLNGQQLLDRAHDLVALLHGSDERLRGELRLGASNTIGTYLLPRLIGSFKEAHPEASLPLEIGNSEQVELRLLAHQLDLAFVERSPTHRRLDARPWLKDRLVVVGAPGHPLAGRRPLGRRELSAARWILREPGSGTLEVFERAMKAAGCPHHAFLTFGHTEAVKQAVTAGLGLSCLSERTLTREIADGSLMRLRTPRLKLEREFWIVTAAHSYESRLRAAFRRHAATLADATAPAG